MAKNQKNNYNEFSKEINSFNKTNVGNPDNHSQKWLNQIYTSGNEWLNRHIISGLSGENDADILLEMQDREMSYITNFYVFDDDKFSEMWPYIVKELYMSGMVGIQMLGGEYLIYNIKQVKENLQYQIIEAEGVIRVLGDEKEVKLNSKNSVLAKASIWGKPWFLFSKHYIDAHIDGLKLLALNLENSQTTRMIQVNRATNERDMEIRSKYYSGSPYVVVSGAIEKTEDIGLDNQSEVLWMNIWENIKLWEKFRVIRHNISKKDTERNNIPELENDTVQFEFIEKDRMRIINKILNGLKELYGITITCKTLIEMEQERNEQKEEQQDDNKTDDKM